MVVFLGNNGEAHGLRVFFVDELEIKYIILVNTTSVLTDCLGHTILSEIKDQSQ